MPPDDESEDDRSDLDLDRHAEWCKANPLERALEEDHKRPRGRPKGSQPPRTESAVLVRVTLAERATMEARAAAAGMPLSAWLRARGLAP